MNNYVFAYHMGNKPMSPDDGAKHQMAWKAWVSGLGTAVVNPGTPLGMSKTVSADGVTDNGGPNPLGGFAIIAAENMDAAIAIAKTDPFLTMGTIEVAQVREMK